MRRFATLSAVAPTTLCMLLAGCGPAQDTPEEAPVTAEAPQPASADQAVLDAALETNVRNARLPSSGIVSSGQPDQGQVEAMRGAGAQAFISLRPSSESGAGWEEAYATAENVAFDRLPITGPESLTRENVEIFADMLDEQGGDPVVVYCGSSNRVGAMLALKAAWIDGMDANEALQIGLDAGLTRLEAPVRELLGLD